MKTNQYKIFETRNCLSRHELVQYASGNLSEKEKNFIERHLQDCELCSEALEGVMEMKHAGSLNMYYDEIVKSFPAIKKTPQKNNTKIYLAAAIISIFALTGVYIYYFNSKPALDTGLAITTLEKTPADAQVTATPHKTENNAADSFAARTDNITAVSKNTRQQPEEIVAENNIATSNTQAAQQETIFDKPEETTTTAAPVTADDTDATAYRSEELARESKKLTRVSEFAKLNTLNSENSTLIANHKISPVYVEMEMAGASQSKIKTAESVDAAKREEQSKAKDDSGKAPPLSYQQQLSNVFKLIDARDYEMALKEISHFKTAHPNDVNGIFYHGLVNFHLQNDKQSLNDFDYIINNRDKVFKEDAQWYKALILTRAAKFKEARTIYNTLIEKNSIYQDRSRQVLEMLADD